MVTLIINNNIIVCFTGYISGNLAKSNETHQQQFDDRSIGLAATNDDDNNINGPFFVLGDVSHPDTKLLQPDEHILIVHCVDNSGKFMISILL